MSFSFDEGLRLKYALIHGFGFRNWMADGTIMAVNESLSLMQKHFDKLDERQEARFKDLENAIRESNETAEKRYQDSNEHAERRYRDSNEHAERRYRDSEKRGERRLKRVDKSSKFQRESNKVNKRLLFWTIGIGVTSPLLVIAVTILVEKGVF